MLIRYKLAIAFGSMGLLACGAGVTAVLLIRGVTVDMAQIVQGSVAKPKAADAVATALQNVGRHWQELRAQRDSKTVEETPGRDVATTVTQDVENFERSLAAAYEVTAYSLTLASAE